MASTGFSILLLPILKTLSLALVAGFAVETMFRCAAPLGGETGDGRSSESASEGPGGRVGHGEPEHPSARLFGAEQD